ncbi:alpha/beta hydrolase [Burkholderia ubonensis]|uniref:Alpha/beta hydrolase n=1 Tax=Burkholderia ubonensis TaxID=101571 RepID=A0A124R8G0_9BURK|nr:alpha/beta hydrolase [Burkholderia ubonensis]AOJ65666.1 alpha/beta hydrolase [Burkholderia ubonensis]KVG58156.1 alpha/beta hydrolase [Burkholderia ubonensis]
MSAEMEDDDLGRFAAHGAAPLPAAGFEGWLEHDGARLWHACYGDGPPVILLHGGLGHAGNWGYRAVLIDSRGHGRSTRDERPYSYERMASDVLAVMDALGLDRARFVGWSDGACIALVLASMAPARVESVFFFGCNMDPGGVKAMAPSAVVDRCFARHRSDYAALSATPDGFEPFVAAVSEMMRTQPDYPAKALAAIDVRVAIVLGEHDEFIRPEHAAYLARTIPGATLTILPGVSHFAPLQRPARFNAAMLAFLGQTRD